MSNMIIFLDFDGIIITFPDTKNANPNCVKALNWLIRKTDAKIVISSDWRKDSNIPMLTFEFDKWGVIGEIIGFTPILDYCSRGDEIIRWMLDNNFNGPYVVIEDEINILGNKIPSRNIINCDMGLYSGGLTMQLVKDYYNGLPEM